MRKIGVQSMGAVDKRDIEGSYKRIKEAGIDFIDFGLDEFVPGYVIKNGDSVELLAQDFDKVYKEFEPHIKAIKKAGLFVGQFHAPFPMRIRRKPEWNERLNRMTINSIKLCRAFDCDRIVIHPVSFGFYDNPQEEWDFNIKMYTELIPFAKEEKVMILLENMFLGVNGHIVEASCSDFAEAARYIDTLNDIAGEELFGFCFDVGHANLLAKNLYKAVTTLGKRIKALHVHDNDGIMDLHTLPFVFARGQDGQSTDWKGFLLGLHDGGYECDINFETYRLMKTFPLELHTEVLRLTAALGRYMSNIIENGYPEYETPMDSGWVR